MKIPPFLITACCITAIFLSCSSCGKKHSPNILFETDLILPSTPVKNQGEWNIGWIYATLSLLESERIKEGDSLQLSANYLLRMLCEEEMLSDKDSVHFAYSPSHCFYLLEKYGIVPLDNYSRHIPDTASYIQEIYRRNSENTRHRIHELSTILPEQPQHFFFFHASYTPHEMLRSIIRENPYEVYSPFPSTSSISEATQEEPRHLSSRNIVPFIRETLYSGHTLVWYGDTLQYGYSGSQGIAFSQQETYSTPPFTARGLHSLHIIGTAHIKGALQPSQDSSTLYFVAKDSHGESNRYNGKVFISENYIRQHTLALYRTKPAKHI